MNDRFTNRLSSYATSPCIRARSLQYAYDRIFNVSLVDVKNPSFEWYGLEPDLAPTAARVADAPTTAILSDEVLRTPAEDTTPFQVASSAPSSAPVAASAPLPVATLVAAAAAAIAGSQVASASAPADGMLTAATRKRLRSISSRKGWETRRREAMEKAGGRMPAGLDDASLLIGLRSVGDDDDLQDGLDLVAQASASTVEEIAQPLTRRKGASDMRVDAATISSPADVPTRGAALPSSYGGVASRGRSRAAVPAGAHSTTSPMSVGASPASAAASTLSTPFSIEVGLSAMLHSTLARLDAVTVELEAERQRSASLAAQLALASRTLADNHAGRVTGDRTMNARKAVELVDMLRATLTGMSPPGPS